MAVRSRRTQGSSKLLPIVLDKFVLTHILRYTHEKLTKEGVEEVIESYKKQGWWP